MVISRGTTPLIWIEVKPDELVLENIKEIWVSISQGGKLVVDRKLSDGTIELQDNSIVVKLTQQETLAMNTITKTLMGIRILLDNGEAYASSLDCSSELTVQNVVKGGLIE